MRVAVWLLFLAQIALVAIGGHASPDYYVRTPESVQAWALSGGLWILILSFTFSISLVVIALRLRRATPWVIGVLSFAITCVWWLQPILFCFFADLLYFRYP